MGRYQGRSLARRCLRCCSSWRLCISWNRPARNWGSGARVGSDENIADTCMYSVNLRAQSGHDATWLSTFSISEGVASLSAYLDKSNLTFSQPRCCIISSPQVQNAKCKMKSCANLILHFTLCILHFILVGWLSYRLR